MTTTLINFQKILYSILLVVSLTKSIPIQAQFNQFQTINQLSSKAFTISLPDAHHFSLIVLVRQASSDLSFRITDGKYINIENIGNIDFKTDSEDEKITLLFNITSLSAYEIDFIVCFNFKSDFNEEGIRKLTIEGTSSNKFKEFSYFFLSSFNIFFNKLQLKLDFNKYVLYFQSKNGKFQKTSLTQMDVYELDQSKLLTNNNVYVLIFENKDSNPENYDFYSLLKGQYKEIHNQVFSDFSLLNYYEYVNIKLNYNQKKQIILLPPSQSEAEEFVIKVDKTENNDFVNGFQSIIGFKRIILSTDQSVYIKCRLQIVEQIVKVILNIKEI